MNILRVWYDRYFTDPQVVILGLLLVVGFMVTIYFGDMLAPVLAGIIIAYLLDGVVGKCTRLGAPRTSAVVLVFIFFMTFLVFALFWLMPRLSFQVTQLVHQLPVMLGQGQEALLRLPDKYPNLFTETQVTELIDAIRAVQRGELYIHPAMTRALLLGDRTQLAPEAVQLLADAGIEIE